MTNHEDPLVMADTYSNHVDLKLDYRWYLCLLYLRQRLVVYQLMSSFRCLIVLEYQLTFVYRLLCFEIYYKHLCYTDLHRLLMKLLFYKNW
jgi:hypothetical protein